LPGQGDDGLLLHGGAGAQLGFHFCRRFPVGLPLQEAPHGLDQQRPHAAVAQPVNAAHAPLIARTVFAGTTPGVTAHLLAVAETPPVAHLAVQGHQRQAAQSLGCDLILHPREQFGLEFRQLGLDGHDQIAQLGQHAQHPRIERGEFRPVARTPPAVRQLGMAILGDLAVPAIGQTADGPGQKLPAARALALALLGLAGDADGGQLVAVAVEPAGEAQAEGAGIQLVGLALAVERDGRDEKTLRARGQQFAMEHKAEAAAFLHTADLEAFGDPFFDLDDELLTGEFAGGVRIGVVFLRHGHDEFEMHVQAELEQGLSGVNDRRGQRLARRDDLHHCRLVRIRGQGYGCGCRDGFEDVFFHRCDDRLFELRSQRGTEWCRVQPIMASNRRCRGQFYREVAGWRMSPFGGGSAFFVRRLHFMDVQTTLNFYGRTEEAVKFYCRTIEAEILFMMRFRDRPDNPELRPGTEEKIFHATFRIGSTEIGASDCGCENSPTKTTFAGFSLLLRVDTPEKAERFFAALSDGGQIQIPMVKTFFAERYGIVIDRFGISWKIMFASRTQS